MSRLIPDNQPNNWFEMMINECYYYPIKNLALSYNSVVVDCGSNVGGFVYAFKDKFNKFYCFEASSYNIDKMNSNLKNYKDKYEVFQVALSNESNKQIKLLKYISDNNEDTPSGNFGIVPFVNKNNNHGWRSDEHEIVNSLCLEDLFKKINSEKIDLLKVDIEGSEYDFLFDKDLSNINFITMELHNFLIDLGQMQKFLDHIKKTHDEVYSSGSYSEHWIKLWKRR